MSVIVKGMEMPSGCQSCDFSDDETRFCKAAKEYIPMLGKPEFCPLVELPEKHGRLIDADAMIEEIKVWKEEGEREAKADGVLKPGSSLVAELLIAYLAGNPTIVEAEGDYV